MRLRSPPCLRVEPVASVASRFRRLLRREVFSNRQLAHALACSGENPVAQGGRDRRLARVTVTNYISLSTEVASMARKEALSMARRGFKATMMLALAPQVWRGCRSPGRARANGVTTPAVRQLAVCRRDRNQQEECPPASGRVDVPVRPDRLQSARRARRRLRAWREPLVRGARRGDGQGDLGPQRRSGFHRARRELLGEQGWRGPPPDLQHEQHPPGDRRANRAEHYVVRRERPGRLRVGLDRDPATIDQQSRIPGRVFENLIILGSATNQEYLLAPGDIRAFDVRTGADV